jgi:hypothetical protein
MKIKEYTQFLALKNQLPAERGIVRVPHGYDESEIRSTEVRWIHRSEFPVVFNIMQEYGRRAQEELGITKVLTIKDSIQLSTYYPGDFYGWHKDGREMSCSLLLTDKFTGGRLEFREHGYPLLRRAGQAIFFHNVEHRVKPVLTGVRDSLVVWWK